LVEIPIENIYHLLCYAWDRLEMRDLVDVSRLDTHEQVDLLACVLAAGTERLLKLGLDRGYLEMKHESRTIRGRIDFSTCIKRFLFPRARAQCTFDELSADVLHNRILKTTLARLARVNALSPDLMVRLVKLSNRMRGVTRVRLTNQVFSRVQLHANSSMYAFLIQICELAYHATLVDERTGEVRFKDFSRDENRMWRLFQGFLLNFYRVHESRTGYRVKSEQRVAWMMDGADHDKPLCEPSLLPEMKPDITLRSSDRTIVMDAKYHQRTLQDHFGKLTIKSGDLYQIFTYLKNLEGAGGYDALAHGVLVYPTVGQPVDATYHLHGHDVRVFTVDLGQHWRRVETQLFSLVGCGPLSPSSLAP